MRELMCRLPLGFESDDGAIIVWANPNSESREIIDVIAIELGGLQETRIVLMDRYAIRAEDAWAIVRDAAISNGNHSQQVVQLDTNARA